MIFIGELQQGAIGADGDDPQGGALPLAARAVWAACSSPPQQGTSMRSRVTLWMELAARMAVSLSA